MAVGKILLLSVLWFSAASVNSPISSFKIPLILDALLSSLGFDIYGPEAGVERWLGGYSGFQLTRVIKGFLGFEIFDSGFFWVGNFGKYFLGWLGFVGVLKTI